MNAADQHRSSIELVSSLTEKLLVGRKAEVFAFLQLLPPARAQRIKEKLISALKKVPAQPAAGKRSARFCVRSVRGALCEPY